MHERRRKSGKRKSGYGGRNGELFRQRRCPLILDAKREPFSKLKNIQCMIF